MGARSCPGTALFWVNRLSKIEHRGPLVGTAWAFRLGHSDQAYGFSPVWVRSCGATWLFWLNRLGPIEHA